MSSKNIIQENNLKVLLERYRGDQNILTAQMVRDLDYVDLKAVKYLYNYNLVSMRERIEMEDEAN
jgi:hypothetical protein